MNEIEEFYQKNNYDVSATRCEKITKMRVC